METKRRKCKLSDSAHKSVNLKEFEDIILETIEKTVPNKHPKVFIDYFSTDVLTQTEAVLLGRALSKIEALSAYGKTVTIFRLFDGKVYDNEESKTPSPRGRKERKNNE